MVASQDREVCRRWRRARGGACVKSDRAGVSAAVARGRARTSMRSQPVRLKSCLRMMVATLMASPSSSMGAPPRSTLMEGSKTANGPSSCHVAARHVSWGAMPLKTSRDCSSHMHAHAE